MIAGPSTDTTKKRLAPGFVITEPATKMNPWLKEWASQFPVTQEGISNGVNAITTNGEVFVPKLGVESAGDGNFELGVMRLEEMNNKPKEGGHASIDRLIAMSTLQGLKPMTRGGEIMPNYAGGGMVEDKMYGYQNGGSIYGMNRTPEGMMQAVYEMPTDDGNRYYLGESLRPQPSLSTQAARQKAMQRAVEMPEDSISFEMVQQILNPEAAEPEGKKGLMGLLGFQGGGSTLSYEKLAPFLGQSKRVHPDTGMPLYDVRQVVSVPAEEVGAGGGLRYYGSEETGDKIENAISEALRSSLETAIMSPQDSIPADMVKKFLKPRKKGIMGLLGFENGGPVNQMPEMLSQQAEALQSGMDQDTTNRARKALQYIKIQTLMNDPTLSKQSYTEFEGEAPSEVADIAKHFYSTVRDSANARALRGMQGHSSGYSPSIYGPR